MANTISVMIRNVVSKKRRRYKEGGFNLDLAYICPNIIAMGYPAEYIQSVFRNPMNDVCNFFENTHREHYKVYNLRSEKAYDVNKFHGRVSVYAFEDHNPPTIELIDKFCKDLDCWLKADRQNVAAIHCKAGKGRTGTMICCYLLYSGFKTTAEDALAYYAEKRTINKKGVTIPSQRRYVQYYAKLIQSQQKYEQRRLQLCEIRFSSATTLQSQSSVHCLVSTMEEVDCTESRASKVHDIDSAGTWTKVTVKELYKFSIDFRKTNNLELYDQYVTGDVKVELKKFFHFWFNTYFICDTAEYEGEGEDMKLIYNLPKWELDDAHKDKEHKLFPEDFKVQLVLKIVSPNACKNMEVREITQMRKRNHNNFVNSLSHDTHTNSNTLLSDQYAHGEAIPTCSKRDDPTFDVYRNYIHQVENSRKPSNLPSHLSSGDGGSNYMPLLYKQRHPQRQKKRNNETMPSINSELINRPNNLNYNSSHFQQQQQQQIQQQLQQQQFQQQLQQQQQQEQHQQQLQLHHHYYQQPTHHRHQPATVFQDQDKTLHSEHQFQLKQQQQQPQPNKCTSTSSNYIHNTASNSNSSSSSSICSQSSSSSSSGCIGGDGDHRADGCFGEEEDWESGESSTTNFSTTTTTTPTTSSHFSYKRLINSSNDDDDGNSNKKDTYDNDGDNDDGDGGGEDDDDDADDDYDDDDGAIAIKINKISSPFSKGVIRTTSTSNTLHYDSIKTPTTTSVVGVSILDDMYKSFNSSLLMTSPSSLVSNSHRKFETIISSDSKANDDASVLNKMLGSYSLSQTTISPTITVKTNTPVREMISSNIVGEEKSSSFEKRFHETPNNTLSKVDNQLVPIKTTTKLTTRSKFLKLIKNQGFKAKTLSSVVSSSPVNSSSVLSACAVVQNQLLKKKKLKSKQIPPSKTFQWLHNYFRTDPDFQENLSQQTTIPMGRRSSVSSISGRNYVNSTGSLKKVVGSDKKKSILLGGLDIRGTFHDYCLVDCQSSGSYKTRCSDPNHGNKITDDFSNSNESKTLVDTGRIKIENKSPTGQRQITNKNKHCEIGHSENAAAILRKNNNIITPLVQDTDTLNCDENLMDEESHALNKLSPTALSIPDSNSDSMSMDHLCLNFTNTSLQQQSKLVTPKTRVNDCVNHTTITMYQDHEDYYSSICDNQLSFNNSPCKSPRSLSDILDLKPAITQPIQKCQTGTGNGLTVISSKSNMVPASIIADNNLIKSASLNDTIVVAKPPESHSIGFNVGLTSPTLTTSTTTSSTSRPHTEKYNSNLDYSILESSASNRSQSELSSDSILNLIINHNNFIEDSSNSPVFVDDPLCSKGIDKPKCYGSTSSSSGYCAASEKSQSVSSTSSGIDDTNSSVDITSNPERICFTNIDVDVESKKKFSLPTPEIGSVKIEMTKIRSSSVSSTNNFSSNDNNRDNNLKSSLLPSSSSSGISTDNNEKN